MKIFTTQQIRAADTYTITKEPIASIDLMERAALACVHWIEKQYEPSFEFKIICGLGNNGGDGLAIARLLAERGYKTETFIVRHSEKTSEDFNINLDRLKSTARNKENILEISSGETFHAAFIQNKKTIVIDALLGSGLNKPVEGILAEVIKCINTSNSNIVSIDVPSGLYCDELNASTDIVICANDTLSFQFPKLSFMFPETADCVGSFSILDIGLHPVYIEQTSTPYFFVTKKEICTFFKKRSRSAHKGNFGHALLIAGSKGKMGAAVLASKACLKSGVGLLTSRVPACGYEIIQTTIPEAMVSVDEEVDFIANHVSLDPYHAIGIGPGIGTEAQTQNVLKLLIQNSRVPLVIDADALNILSENKTWLAFIPANSILTPHPREFERMAGKAINSAERLKLQREFSIKNKVYVVLKGAHTSVAAPDGNIYFNSTGNPGMAKAGSGDALTGIITALVAQGYSSQQACVLGVYLHGLAGDFAAHTLSEESMLAGDLIESLAEAFRFLY